MRQGFSPFSSSNGFNGAKTTTTTTTTAAAAAIKRKLPSKQLQQQYSQQALLDMHSRKIQIIVSFFL
jgi:hypothetical protein